MGENWECVNTPTRVYLPRRDVPQLGEREMVLSDVVEMPCSLFQRDVSLDSIHSFPLYTVVGPVNLHGTAVRAPV